MPWDCYRDATTNVIVVRLPHKVHGWQRIWSSSRPSVNRREINTLADMLIDACESENYILTINEARSCLDYVEHEAESIWPVWLRVLRLGGFTGLCKYILLKLTGRKTVW